MLRVNSSPGTFSLSPRRSRPNLLTTSFIRSEGIFPPRRHISSYLLSWYVRRDCINFSSALATFCEEPKTPTLRLRLSKKMQVTVSRCSSFIRIETMSGEQISYKGRINTSIIYGLPPHKHFQRLTQLYNSSCNISWYFHSVWIIFRSCPGSILHLKMTNKNPTSLSSRKLQKKILGRGAI